MNEREWLPPTYGEVGIVLHAGDVPGKLPDEQAEVKERQFQKIKSDIMNILWQTLSLPENWKWGVIG